MQDDQGFLDDIRRDLESLREDGVRRVVAAVEKQMEGVARRVAEAVRDALEA